jgi:hypothetical protein
LYGVKGDGATNDRAALQAALDASVGWTLLITGQCRIDVKGLDIRSGSRVPFAPGASISLLPHTSASYQMLRVWDARDVLIENASLDGQKRLNRTKPDPKGGGFGMGISLAGSTNIRIVAPVTNDCWGDGIYIANSCKTHAPSSSIHVYDHRPAVAAARAFQLSAAATSYSSGQYGKTSEARCHRQALIWSPMQRRRA